ncbi:GntR family transcriptional regulator [Actinomycetospora sp. TBRC 11914]|uniref:GntR family transcriptional regulator n=1 Tax=Actinomycetospora sp. TBRC 11914 TaxID=2729387 RepID=UPI00145D01A5|nr:GntR family transcriptional regulator [Actinomycetospora sp. TBRC 11914]NMO89383.1 GntR family transcriptional regulator [Actinomycetospora sp. TBRC 11914]
MTSGTGRAAAPLGDGVALPDRVALLLRDRILSGELAPGTFLRVDRLGEELGVSQTPVREALQSLRADDMVRALPRRGYVVAEMTRGDVADLFAAQAHLTGELAARAAVAVGSTAPGHLATLREHDAEVGRLLAVCDGQDGGPLETGLALAHAEHGFHAAVNRAAGSRKLAWLAGCAERYLPPRFYTASAAWRSATRRSHATLLDALAAGDAEAAREAMSRHVLDGRDLLLAHLDTIAFWPGDSSTDPTEES